MLGGQAADTKMHYEALKNMEFNVVVDCFPNPTTMAVADLILPAASIAEKESLPLLVEPAAGDDAGHRRWANAAPTGRSTWSWPSASIPNCASASTR